MRKLAWLLILSAGCAAGSARYSESDNRTSISADLGTTFDVSLPTSMAGKAAYSSSVLTLSKDRVDLSQRRILEFAAAAPGETEIKVGTDFSLRVRVTSASDRPGMHLNH